MKGGHILANRLRIKIFNFTPHHNLPKPAYYWAKTGYIWPPPGRAAGSSPQELAPQRLDLELAVPVGLDIVVQVERGDGPGSVGPVAGGLEDVVLDNLLIVARREVI